MKNIKITIVLITAIFGGMVQPTVATDHRYKEELKAFKKKPPYTVMFDKYADGALRDIIRDVENCKEMTPFQRTIRTVFLSLDTVVVTPATMPKLHGYITSICDQRNIKVPTILITKDKWLFNAAAHKLLMSSGAILIGQNLLHEVSDEELEAVVTHEIGHIFHNHTNKHLATMTVSTTASTLLFLTAALSSKVITKFVKQKPNRLQPVMGGCTVAGILTGSLLATLLIGKRYEKQADKFACATIGKGDGLIKLFEQFKQKRQNHADAFDITSKTLSANRHRIPIGEYFSMNVKYYLAKAEYKIDKVLERWFGSHPSPDQRIKAVKEYFDTEKA